ncbi:MAG: hypothetical protein AUJ20_11340 [Comamonadaceae bacterium CG1_02_60_18]|nr:MAG: hypothetical protein AUJ20_11340 [Comamonadaceae bacterium CG1_02_60_18]PIQ52913.1 MAG: hypothetical protein COW02_09115 [Comamonadaceae bacterium CG12_big_fil_rev_8_21_14_0_65_59_15]
MYFKLRLIPAATAAVLLVACGGGGGSTGSITYTPTSGVGVDGYLQFSKVVCDTNDNGVANTGEPVSYTTSEGVFIFPQGCTHGVILTGGKSKDTQLAFTGQLKAPAGAKVVSTVTSLVAAGMTVAEVNKALGLPATTDLLNTDPVAVSSTGALVNPELLKKTLAVQQLLQKVTETFAGLVSATGSAAIEPIYNEVAAGFASALKAGASTLMTGTALDETVVNTLVKAAGERVLTAATVMSAVQTAITSKGGAAVLANVTSAALKVQGDAYLGASDTASEITSLTLDRQTNTSITSAVVAANLSSTTSATDVASLAAQTKTEAAKPTSTSTTPAAPGVLASFDEATPPTVLGFNGAEGSSIMAGPSGGSGKAVNVLRTGGDPWAGVVVTTGAIPFTATRKTITARVYSPVAGVPMVIKVEDATTPPNASAEIASSAPVVVGWQTLTWVMTGLDLTKTYTKVVLLPKLGTVSPVSGDSFFFDDITLAPADTSTTTPTIPASGLLTSFDEATVPTILGFNGAEGSSIMSGPSGGSGKAVNVLRTGGDPWAGVVVTTGAIPFTATRKTITARVYSPVAGVPMVIKVEDANGAASAEIAATPTVAVGWQTLTWAMTGVDLTKTYTKVVLLPKLGTVSPVSGDSFFFDDITLAPEQATPPTTPTNYLYLTDNALSLFDGTSTTSYSMAQFQSAAGINVKWPMANNAALKLNLAENGSFTLASGQTMSAAVAITQDTPAGAGEVKAYIDNVNVTKTGNTIQVTVPTTANAIVYGVSGDGKTKAIIDFANSVKGVTNTFSSAVNAVSTVVLGEVVNYAVNGVSNDFTGMYALRGKYKVSIVVTNLPLRQTDGTAFGNVTIQVPTKLDATGAATTSVPVTGPGLEGYINLTN